MRRAAEAEKNVPDSCTSFAESALRMARVRKKAVKVVSVILILALTRVSPVDA